MVVKKIPIFVVQKHYARQVHYDLRLEMRGTLKSWAVPKGIPRSIGDKKLAILTQNHPLIYAEFEGDIPEGHYGEGKVKIHDQGIYDNQKKETMSQCFRNGEIVVVFKGKKLKGLYALVHMEGKKWLFIKMRKKNG